MPYSYSRDPENSGWRQWHLCAMNLHTGAMNNSCYEDENQVKASPGVLQQSKQQ